MKNYSQYVDPHLKRFKPVQVPAEKIEKIRAFVDQVIEAKKKEKHHMIDSGSEYTRFYTGTLGEAAVEELLGVELIDWSIGQSAIYNEGDLKKFGLDIGIKTVEHGKFPIIHKNVKRPEVINLKMDESRVLVCGLATVDVLRDCQDDSLILSPNLRRRGTKTGFYGFDRLVTFQSLDDLRRISKQHV